MFKVHLVLYHLQTGDWHIVGDLDQVCLALARSREEERGVSVITKRRYYRFGPFKWCKESQVDPLELFLISATRKDFEGRGELEAML